MEFLDLGMSVEPQVEGFLDPASTTGSYIVNDTTSGACAVINSVLDIDFAAGRIVYDSAYRLIDAIQHRELTQGWIIETHAHADNLSAAHYLSRNWAARSAFAYGSRRSSTPSAVSSMRVPSFSGTDRSSMSCSRTATPMPSAG